MFIDIFICHQTKDKLCPISQEIKSRKKRYYLYCHTSSGKIERKNNFDENKKNNYVLSVYYFVCTQINPTDHNIMLWFYRL